MSPRHVTVLGGGLTGLTAAYRLSERLPQTKITLIEASNRLGGWVESSRHNVSFKDQDGAMVEGSVVLEGGPRTIRPRGSRGAPRMLKLIHDLGLRDSIIPIPKTHPAATSRFLLDSTSTPKSLVKLPSSLLSLAKPQHKLLKGLLLNAALEPTRRSRSGMRVKNGQSDESVHSFFTRRFGERIATNLASAMVHGIYAADSRSLSVRSAFPSLWDAEAKYGSVLVGSVLGGGTKTEQEKRDWEEVDMVGMKQEAESWSIYGLQGGTQSLVRRMIDRLGDRGVEMVSGQKVRSASVDVGGVKLDLPSRTVQTDHIISALPKPAVSSLFPLTTPSLSSTSYTTVGVVNLVFPFPSSSIHPAGFGYLVPRTDPELNPQGILGVIFDSTALPGNDDPSVSNQITKLTVMMGGPWWSTYAPGAKSPPSAEDLIVPALEHLREVFPVLQGVEPLIAVPRLQKDCIPTYAPGHGGKLRDLHQTLSSSEWRGKLSLVGNGYGGVGVNDCVISAGEAVDGLVAGDRPTGLERWDDWQ